MDDVNEWYQKFVDSPLGSLLLFLAVFLTRVAIARWDAKRTKRKRKKPKGHASG